MRGVNARAQKLASVIDAVGHTPLVRLRHVGRDVPKVHVYLKLEYTNPGGSVKDRPALKMIQDALADGRLSQGKTLIDSTSGNTGVAYSMFGAALGIPVTLVMPANVSQARKDIARTFGTELVFSDPMEGSDGAIRHCRELVAQNPDRYFYPDQYSNPSNPKAHELGTAREIIDALGAQLTHFVAGVGTSGTLMGVTRGLKSYREDIQCVGVEPAEALHGLEGLKHMPSSMVPAIYDASLPDAMMAVGTEDGWQMADRLAAEEGLHVGHSTGANVYGAIKLAKQIQEGTIVTIACDRGDRYFAPMRWERHYDW